MKSKLKAEMREKFFKRSDPGNYEKEEWKNLKEPNDSLLEPVRYPESEFEYDEGRLLDFIDTQIDKAYSAGEEEERKRIFTAYGVPKELEEEFNNQSNEI